MLNTFGDAVSESGAGFRCSNAIQRAWSRDLNRIVYIHVQCGHETAHMLEIPDRNTSSVAVQSSISWTKTGILSLQLCVGEKNLQQRILFSRPLKAVADVLVEHLREVCYWNVVFLTIETGLY